MDLCKELKITEKPPATHILSNLYETKNDSFVCENTSTSTNKCEIVKEKKKKKKKNRCNNCNKAIGFLKLTCKCSDRIFCSSCILPEVHMCTINYKEKKESLKKKLVKIQNNKVPPI